MKRQRYVNVTASPAIPDNGRAHCFLMRSCSRCMVVWPLAKYYNVVVALLTALPPAATPMMPLSLSYFSFMLQENHSRQTDTWAWHCFCFFTCEVRALHKYSGKEALLSLPSALGILGMALERASGGYHPRNRRSRHGSCRSIQLGPVASVEHSIRQNAHIPNFMSLPR